MSKRFLISEEEKKHILNLYEQRISDLPQNQQSTTPKPNLGQTPKTKDLRSTLSPPQQQQYKDMTRGQKDLSKVYYGEMSPVNKPANVVKKVRLIFPSSKWEEFGLSLLKQFKIFTGFFRSLGEALNIVDDMAKNGVKTEELVIGSHGGGEQLLTTQKEGSFTFNNSFLEKVKQIVSPTTKVFFTACHGADYLEVLKDAAEKLGVGAYASSGVYNYVTNKSEKGFYYCSPQPYELPVGDKVVQPLNSTEEQKKYGDINIKYLSNVYPNEVTYTIKTDIFGAPLQITKKLNFKSTNYGGSHIQKGKFEIDGWVKLKYDIEEYIERIKNNPGENKDSDTLFNSYRAWMKKTPNMDEFLATEFINGKIKIFVNNIDVKTFKPFSLPNRVDNDFFLSNGLCRKVNGSPVSWFESVN
jgi:hypothetical protein